MNPSSSKLIQASLPRLSLSRMAARALSLAAEVVSALAWYRDRVLLGSLVLALVADQVSKALVRRWMEVGEAIPREGPVRLEYVVNTGSAFGVFHGPTLFLVVASLAGVVFLAAFYRSHARLSLGLRLGIGLMLGGALGNLADRLVLGGVTDFIAVGWWPNFNLADSSIVVGMAVVGLTLLRGTASVTEPPDGRGSEELWLEASDSCAGEPSGSHW